MTKRNDRCPCGSGKKYKMCCLEKDRLAAQEAERKKAAEAMEAAAKAADIAPGESEPEPPKFATWKLFLVGLGIIGVISLICAICGFSHAAGAIFGCGFIALFVYCAFRDVPPLRKQPGSGGNINFGNRS